jgi:4-hydroxybenzoyl-CoA thioesterase
VRLEADFKAVSVLRDAVALSLRVERLGQRSLTLQLRCTGPADDVRMSLRQVIVTTSLATHQSIDIPDDLRIGIDRFVAATH